MKSPPAERTSSRAVLPALIKGRIGRYQKDDSIAIGRSERPEIALYGPYWSLPAGTYHLDFACEKNEAPDEAVVFLAVEVLVDNRVFLALADYCWEDLRGGRGSLQFEVAPEFGIGSASPGQIEFRFLSYGRVAFVLKSAELRQISDTIAHRPVALVWRLSARARPTRLPWTLAANADGKSGCRLARRVRFAPPLSLPHGTYRLSFCVVRGELLGRVPCDATVSVIAGRRLLASRRFCLSVRAFDCELTFDVPQTHSFAHGAAEHVEFTLAGLIAPRFKDIVLRRIGEPPEPAATSAIIGKAQPCMVIVGNCQAELLTEGFRRQSAGRLGVKYHFVGLAERFHDAARADLRRANVVLIQDISDVANYPLKDVIPTGAEVHRFPMLRCSTPWPFDTHNGMPDREAEARETVEPLFLNLDGVLGRLRREVPDRVERFDLYRRLDIEWLPDFVRLAHYEERRLLAMDRTYGCTLGAYILDNIQKRQVFHSIAHPTDALFGELLQHIRSMIGLRKAWFPSQGMSLLDNVEVPIHPLVAARAGIRWATEARRYNFRNQPVTWAHYTRRYIEHFG
jgi:Polysaccharide biosynthesis enzyme WcbI